jgi:hypothetical protein
MAAAFATRTRDEWVAELGPADTCVAPVNTVAEAVADEQYTARGVVADAVPRDRGAVPPDGADLGGHHRARRPRTRSATATVTDTADLLLAAGMDRDDVEKLRRGGRDRVNPPSGRRATQRTSPSAVTAMIGEPMYPETASFPVERSYAYNTSSATENGNPLYWDDDVASELTGGPVMPPTTLSLWMRPHYWEPGARASSWHSRCTSTSRRCFGLPEAVMTDNTMIFHEPVRPGDVIRTPRCCGRSRAQDHQAGHPAASG